MCNESCESALESHECVMSPVKVFISNESCESALSLMNV